MIDILVTILLPSLNRAKELASRTVCLTSLHGVAVAFVLYLEQSNKIMPVAAQMPSLELNEDPRIADVLEPYLSTPESLRCPGDKDKDYFASEGSSYEYHTMLGGKEVGDSFLTQLWGEQKTPVMNDYEERRDRNDGDQRPTERRRRGRRGFTPERMKQRIENTPPEHRAKMVEVFKAMRERKKQRGGD